MPRLCFLKLFLKAKTFPQGHLNSAAEAKEIRKAFKNVLRNNVLPSFPFSLYLGKEKDETVEENEKREKETKENFKSQKVRKIYQTGQMTKS